MKGKEDMTLEEAKALIANADRLEAEGKLSTDEELLAAGFVYGDGVECSANIMYLPIPVHIAKQLVAEKMAAKASSSTPDE